MEKKIKIGFIGGGERSFLTFTELVSRVDVEILYSVFMPGYEDELIYCTKLEETAHKHNLRFISSDKITKEIIEEINKIELDVIIDGGLWRSIINPEFWKSAKYGLIGPHGSLLPAYKGWAGFNWYVLNGEKEYGLQVFQVSKHIDSGKQVIRKNDRSLVNIKMSLENQLMARELLDIVNVKATEVILETIDLIKSDNIDFEDPDDSQSTWTCSRGPEDGEIYWDQPTKTVFNFIRAQSHPYPGAFSFHDGEKVFFWKVCIPVNQLKYVGVIPGRIVKVDNKNKIIWVMTKDGVIEVSHVSFEKTKDQIKNATEYFQSVREKFGLNYFEELKKIKAAMNL